MPPHKPIKKRIPRKNISSRAKNLSAVYREEFDTQSDDFTNSTFKSPYTAHRFMSKTTFITFIIGIFLGGMLGLFFSNKGTGSEINNSGSFMRPANRTLEERVADLVRHQSSDKPVVAVVKDVSMLSDIPMYQFAQNGDTVVVYKDFTAIYDSAQDKMVSVIPQNILKENSVVMESESKNEENTSDPKVTEEKEPLIKENIEPVTPQAPVVPAKDVTVEVRNGTSIEGLAGKRSKELQQALGYTVLSSNAVKKSYTESVVVDLSGGKLSDHVTSVREKFGITKVLTKLPDGEASAKAQIVVILAK